MGAETFHALKKVLKDEEATRPVSATRAGSRPTCAPTRKRSRCCWKASRAPNYKPGKDVCIAIDAAATEFYENGQLRPRRATKPKSSRADGHGAILGRMGARSTRSSRSKTAWPKTTGTGGRSSRRRSATSVQLVGDDIFVTNEERLRRGIDAGVAKAVLIKLNQIGTLTETCDSIEMAKSAGYTCVISHRSGETEDTTISHLAVATNAGQIKTGSLCRSERIAKYNELLRIDEELGVGRDVSRVRRRSRSLASPTRSSRYGGRTMRYWKTEEGSTDRAVRSTTPPARARAASTPVRGGERRERGAVSAQVLPPPGRRAVRRCSASVLFLILAGVIYAFVLGDGGAIRIVMLRHERAQSRSQHRGAHAQRVVARKRDRAPRQRSLLHRENRARTLRLHSSGREGLQIVPPEEDSTLAFPSLTQNAGLDYRCDKRYVGAQSIDAGWSSLVARWAHNPKVAGSNPAPATKTKNPGTEETRCRDFFFLEWSRD